MRKRLGARPVFVSGPPGYQKVDVDGRQLAAAVSAVLRLPHEADFMRQLHEHHHARLAEVQPRSCPSARPSFTQLPTSVEYCRSRIRTRLQPTGEWDGHR